LEGWKMRPPHGGKLQGPLNDTLSRIYNIFSALSPARVQPRSELSIKDY
jgi:hypothetical protein